MVPRLRTENIPPYDKNYQSGRSATGQKSQDNIPSKKSSNRGQTEENLDKNIKQTPQHKSERVSLRPAEKEDLQSLEKGYKSNDPQYKEQIDIQKEQEERKSH